MKLVGLLLEDVKFIKNLKKTHTVTYIGKLPTANPIWHTYVAIENKGSKNSEPEAYTATNNTDLMSKLQGFTSQAEQRLARLGFPHTQAVLVFTDSLMPASGDYKVGEAAAQYHVKDHGILMALKDLQPREPVYYSTATYFVQAADNVSNLVHEHAHHFWFNGMSKESKDLFVAWYDSKIASVDQEFSAEEKQDINWMINAGIEAVFFDQLLSIERLKLDKKLKIDKRGNPIESSETGANPEGQEDEEEFEFADAEDILKDLDPDDPENLLPVILKRYMKDPRFMLRKNPPGPLVHKPYQSSGKMALFEPNQKVEQIPQENKLLSLSKRIALAISKFLAPLDFTRAVWGEDGEFIRMQTSYYGKDTLRDKAIAYTKLALDKYGDKIRNMVVRKDLYGPTAKIKNMRDKLVDALGAPSGYSLSNPQELWAEIVEYCSKNQSRDPADGVARELKTMLYRVLSTKG